MDSLGHLLEQNKKWAEEVKRDDPDFFEKLSFLQTPEYLWIGCSDSRLVPAASIGLSPGHMFVHRNIANLVVNTDMNCLSVIQYAVEVLRVKHVIVCGHYGCGGVKAALDDTRLGLIDNWLRHIQNLIHKYEKQLSRIEVYEKRFDQLCEINVVEQTISLGETTIVQDAWLRNQKLSIHGWIYDIADGIYRDLKVTIESLERLDSLRLKTINQPQKIGIGR